MSGIAPTRVVVGYDGWYEVEVLATTGLGLPEDVFSGRREHVLSTIASLFLNPDFIDEFSQAMAWLALVSTYAKLPVDCTTNHTFALTAIDNKMQALNRLQTPFAHRNMSRFVDYITSCAPKPGSVAASKRLDFSRPETYDGDMSLVLPTIAFEHTALNPKQVNFYDRAVARLALWAVGAQIPLGREQYVELYMTVQNPHQGWRQPDLSNPHVRMALYVLEHARLHARIEGIIEHKH